MGLVAGIVTGVVLFGIFRVALHRVVADQLQAAVTQIPGCTGIRYRSLTIPYLSLECEVQDAVLLFAGVADAIPLGTLHVRRFQPGSPFPRVLEAAVRGAVIHARQPALAPLRDSLQTLAIETLTLDASVRWAREGEETERWRMGLDLQSAGFGRAVFAFRLDKVNPEGVALALEKPVNWFLVLPPMKLVAASGRYEDRGWVERLLTVAARRQGRPPEEVQKALAQNFQVRAQGAREPVVRAFWQALEDFSRHPGRLAFQTRLSRPLPLGQLMWMRETEAVVRGLALEVTTH